MDHTLERPLDNDVPGLHRTGPVRVVRPDSALDLRLTGPLPVVSR